MKSLTPRWGGGPLYLLRRLARSSAAQQLRAVHFQAQLRAAWDGRQVPIASLLVTMGAFMAQDGSWAWLFATIFLRQFFCDDWCDDSSKRKNPYDFNDIVMRFPDFINILSPVFSGLSMTFHSFKPWFPKDFPWLPMGSPVWPVSGAAILVHCGDRLHLSSGCW